MPEIKTPQTATSPFEAFEMAAEKIEKKTDTLYVKIDSLRALTDEFAEADKGGSEWDKLLDKIEAVESELIALETASENIQERFKDAGDEFSERIRSIIGSFNVSDDPTERIKQEIGNTIIKLDLLQKKWQELSTADPTDNVKKQLVSVQDQIIATTKKLEKLEEKLSSIKPTPGIADDSAITVDMPAPDKYVALGEKLAAPVSRFLDTANAGLDRLTAPFEKIGQKASDIFGAIRSKASDAFDGARKVFDGFAASVLSSGGRIGKILGAILSTILKTGSKAASVFGRLTAASLKFSGKALGAFGRLTASADNFGGKALWAFNTNIQ